MNKSKNSTIASKKLVLQANSHETRLLQGHAIRHKKTALNVSCDKIHNSKGGNTLLSMRDGRKLLASGREKVMIIPADSFHDMHSTVTIRKMSLTSILILFF